MTLSNIIPWRKRDHIEEELAAAANLADEVGEELAVEFPPLTPTQAAIQTAENALAKHFDQMSDHDGAAAYHSREADRHRALRAEHAAAVDAFRKTIESLKPALPTPEPRKGKKPVAMAAE